MWYAIIIVGGLIVLIVGASVLATRRSAKYRNARGGMLKQQSAELLQKGDYRGALRKDLKALSIFEKTGYDRARVATHIAVARISLALDELPQAVAHLETAYRDSRKPEYEQFHIESAELLGDCAMQQRNPQAAADFYKESADLEEEETSDDRFPSQRVPLLGGGQVITGRPLLEVVMRRVYALLGRANVARAHIAAGDFGQARNILQGVVTSLEAVKDPQEPQAGVGLHAAYLFQIMAGGGLPLENVSKFMDDVRRASRMALAELDRREEGSDAVERACRVLLSYRPMIAQALRRFKFG